MTVPLSRRSFLLAGAGGLAVTLLPMPTAWGTPAETFAELVRRWQGRLTGDGARTAQTAADPQVVAAVQRLDTVRRMPGATPTCSSLARRPGRPSAA